MNAGRELDALVAEKVMGWTITAPNWGSREVFPPFKDCDCTSHSEAETVPDYSTDIAAAWEVLDKLDQSWWPEVGRMIGGSSWYCEICLGATEARDVGPSVRIVQPTAPHAICLAVAYVLGAWTPE